MKILFQIIALIAILFSIACAPDPTKAPDPFPVSSNFACAKTHDECMSDFYTTLVAWYGVTAFSLKHCDLWPGTCGSFHTFEAAYRGY